MEFLYELYASTRAEEMELTGWSAEQREAFLRMQFQAQHTHYQKFYAEAAFDVIERDGEPIGRFYVYRGAREIRLMEITLRPDCRGQGIGGTLTRELLEEAAREGKYVVLHVEPDNPAKRLYERLGFVDVRQEGVYLRMHWLPPDFTGGTD
jgi:ribosomal protein S18 acetylase RimI-like enzyme